MGQILSKILSKFQEPEGLSRHVDGANYPVYPERRCIDPVNLIITRLDFDTPVFSESYDRRHSLRRFRPCYLPVSCLEGLLEALPSVNPPCRKIVEKPLLQTCKSWAWGTWSTRPTLLFRLTVTLWSIPPQHQNCQRPIVLQPRFVPCSQIYLPLKLCTIQSVLNLFKKNLRQYPRTFLKTLVNS